MTDNKWIWITEWSLIDTIKIKAVMIVSMCTIANYELEHEYIELFIHYYFDIIKIDNMYLYEDIYQSSTNFTSIDYINNLIEQGKIIYIQTKLHNQTLIYYEFYKEYGNDFDWCCMFDVDEFLILKKHNTIKELILDDNLKLYDNCDCILITWKNYGTNGNIYKPSNIDVFYNYYNQSNVIECFLTFNKIIIHGGLENLVFYLSHAAIADGKYYKTKYINGKINITKELYDERNANNFLIIKLETPEYDIAELSHFISKSVEEFVIRKSKGRIDDNSLTPRNALKLYFEAYNYNLFYPLVFNDITDEITLFVIKYYDNIIISIYIDCNVYCNLDRIVMYYKEHAKFDRIYIRCSSFCESDYLDKLISCGYLIIIKGDTIDFYKNICDFNCNNRLTYDFCFYTRIDLMLFITCDIHHLLTEYDYENNECILINKNYMLRGLCNGYFSENDNFTLHSNKKYVYNSNDAYIIEGWSELKELILINTTINKKH